MKAKFNQPLNDKEIDRLDEFLASLGPAAMNLEIIDGFFTALLCGPELIKPTEWVPEIWGGKISIESEQEAVELLDLLFRHWNVVADEMTRAVVDPDARQLLLAEDDHGKAHGNDWAHGFICGVLLREDDWTPLFETEERRVWMEPILMLHHEDDPDPKLRTYPIPDKERDILFNVVTMAVAQIYAYFEPFRRARDEQAMQAQMRREEPKIGRNDPCPCGSGKKYKQCCGAKPTMH